MPIYAYRREDGSTFEIRQKFLDEPLTVCPTTGQPVNRIVQAPGIIFKGSGFYVTDNKGASKTSANGNSARKSEDGNGSSTESGSTSTETKAESKPVTEKAASD